MNLYEQRRQEYIKRNIKLNGEMNSNLNISPIDFLKNQKN